MDFIVNILKLGLVFTVIRGLFKFIWTILCIIALIAIVTYTSGNTTSAATKSVLTYEQLRDYPVDCKFKEKQLAELKEIQRIKNFAEDPDLIVEDADKQYNARLKATIWWFAYGCEK